MENLDAKTALEKLSAAEFKKNNGIVMRACSIAFPVRWFKLEEMETVVSDRIKKEELKKTLIYLSDENYIKARHKTKTSITDIVDYNLDELEFRVSPKGTRIIECVEQNSLIEM